MIAVIRKGVSDARVAELCERLRERGLETHVSVGTYQTIIGLVGDTASIDIRLLESLDEIEQIKRVSEPFKKANRKFHPEDSVVEVGGVKIGGGTFTVMAGPCSVESEEQCMIIAEAVKAHGGAIFRGGAFKPRTSPYAFQGMGREGLGILSAVKERFGLPTVSEIMDAHDLPYFEDIDILQVGARNMQNFQMLKALGKTQKPVLFKRGLSATISEWLNAAEYIAAGGNENIIFCERGIRTYETYTRNTMDLNAIAALKELTHFPVIADPSHGTGRWQMVRPLARASVAVGADGLIIEVHCHPELALSDGDQSLIPRNFEMLMDEVRQIAPAVGRRA